MMAIEWTWAALTLVAFAILFLVKKDNEKLPPSPRGLPILGHLHKIGKNMHQDLYQLAKEHGPIMCIRFGSIPINIVSSPQAAEKFLKTYDLVFASRPAHEGAKIMSYGQKDVASTHYGAYWRQMRKLCILKLLSNVKINSFRSMRSEELGLLIDSIKQAVKGRAVVDVSAKVASLSADMSCRMVFGRKYTQGDFHERGFKEIIQERLQLMGTPNLGDIFPYLRNFDLQGLTRRMKEVAKTFDEFLDMIIKEHIQSLDKEKPRDFVDTMIILEETSFQLDRSHLKAMLLVMLTASMDTSSSTIDWALAELLKNPHIMKKVQEEIKEVVGVDRMVEESDLDKFKYLDMVVKETFRLHPALPLLLPHESMDDCEIDGFHIPKKSRVFINVWAIGRDPNSWTDPEKFMPERFIGANVDVRGHDFQLIPFGSGRRICPGLQLGLIVVRLVLAQLVHCFDWELPNGMLPNELDMTEEFSTAAMRAKHLMAIPSLRIGN